MMRFQVELEGDEQARFEALKQKLKLQSNKDLFENALTLLEWAVQVVNDGDHVAEVASDRKQYTLVKLPALERYRERLNRVS